MPFISISSGIVTRRSISSAAWPGHWVMISTWGGERSGYASIGRFWNENAPQTRRANEAMTMRNPCRRANETSLAIIPSEPSSDVVGELEEEAAIGHDVFAIPQSAGNLDHPVLLRPDGYRALGELAWFHLYIGDRLVLVVA